MTARRIRPTYANLVSTMALAVALSGGAYAATQLPKDSVRSKQIKNNSVKSKDLKDGAVTGADLKPDVLAGVVRDPDLAAALTDYSTHGFVDATLDDRLEDYVAGQRDDAAATLTAGTGAVALLSIPAVVSVNVACSAAGPNRGLEIQVVNQTVGNLDVVLHQRSEIPALDTIDTDVLPAGPAGTTFVFPPDTATASARYFRLTAISNNHPIDVEVSGVTSTLAGGCLARGSAFFDGEGPV